MLRLLPLCLLSLLFLTGCGERSNPNQPTLDNDMDVEQITEEEATPSNMAPEFIDVLDAHGGLEAWNSYQSVTFTLRDFPSGDGDRTLTDVHRVNLRDREQVIRGENYVVVSTGDTTWASPNLAATGVPPRMYQGASFYLFGMPFVFSDPGITVVSHGDTEFGGETLEEFEVTMPGDLGDGGNGYRLFVDPQTKQLQYGTWTVMYPAVKDMNLAQMVHYQEWQTVGGLTVPARVALYTAPGEVTPDTPGATFYFEEVSFSDQPFAKEDFRRPENGVADMSYQR